MIIRTVFLFLFLGNKHFWAASVAFSYLRTELIARSEFTRCSIFSTVRSFGIPPPPFFFYYIHILIFSGTKVRTGDFAPPEPEFGANSGKRVLDARVLDPNSWVEFFDTVFPAKEAP